MKINRALLTNGISQTYVETVDFSHVNFDPSHIKSIPECEVKATVTDYESILRVALQIKATVIGVCSYTLEDVELKFNLKDELDFSSEEESEGLYYEKDNIIDLDEYILGIILANVPVRIIKKGAKRPEGGNNYRVLSEEEYLKEKEQSHDNRWDILDSVKIDED